VRFLLDANMPRSAVDIFCQFGHEVEYAWDIGLHSAPDIDIANRAQRSRAVVVTRDLDFSDVRFYRPASYAGIIVLRLPNGARAREIVRVLERILSERALVEALPGRLAIVDRDGVRLRPPLP
jgi:predicted nuclease of predicted toxin-antitoxin system